MKRLNAPTHRTPGLHRLSAGVLALALGAGLALGEPAARGDRPDRPTNQAQQERPQRQPREMLDIKIDPDALRARLSLSIERAQDLIKLHEVALAKLDEGASPAEVLQGMKLQGFARRSADDQPTTGRDRRNERGENTRMGDGRPPMSPAHRQQLLGFLREHLPDLWKNLEPIAKANPASADRLVGRMSPQIDEILLLKKSEPELAQIKIDEMRSGLQFVEASREFRVLMKDEDASDAQREAAFSKLHKAATERFDVQLRAKEYEVAMLETRLNELKESINTIEHRRETEVENMMLAAKSSLSKGDRKEKKSGND